MLGKVLIANRGEIALRIVRACQELGIRSVAVYSDADAQSPHVREADEAVYIGPAPALESYLRGERIVEAARATGADAIHPGYGFLAERAWFAELVRDSGLIFVGPPPEAIAAMGSKTSARAIAMKSGVPVVPGTTDAVESPAHAARIAKDFGYPVLLKAAAGGGGKGMRLVRGAESLAAAFESAQREAKNAFGDDAIYVEKYIERPRHIEIQLLADVHGTILSLGERECSVQRRHQKMLEESPSLAVNPDLRRRMGDTAIAVARAVGYVNAGTCEFLLDPNGNFYFLEMNTRVQVEHPVTEMVTGVDIVQWQLRIAGGEALPFPTEIAPRGWALECRITSEDPANGFLPSTGRIRYLHVPAGPGVRWDGGIEAGSEIGLAYDPLLAKLIAWGSTREQAVSRMHRALRELTIVGIETSREFHIRMLEDTSFRRGAVDVQWLERSLQTLVNAEPPVDIVHAAAVAAALLADRDRGTSREPGAAGGRPTSDADSASTNSARWRDTARREALR